MYSCRWFEHAYMHMFSGIDIHMLIHVNTDRMARACLPPSMYTCICSRALWYIYYACIQTCICSSRVEPYTHSCSHTYGHLCSHTYKHMHMHTHTRTLVHTWVNAEIWDLVRKAMYSETRWNQKAFIPQTAWAVRGSYVDEKRDLGPNCWVPAHSEPFCDLSARRSFICKYA